ncbi:YdeI/OmpD-associated family protein [Solitalea lacus]|uniref:YdeI/OmpD-associated family protein n=1 Tax=Solitalea lacus TaxID=2911172 RepID=UPI001EDC4293|nr:YdeI/OmpD-associated family protein [Solitalea lacus]UKJ06079.1 YdeI/OmpD-associated family protein [Solitalea lacus]
MTSLIIDQTVQLQKFPGKAGWTYAPLDLKGKESKKLNYLKVKGSIDTYELAETHLMPIGNGKLFIPVKAEIRKKIRKEAGDWVQLILYRFNPENETATIDSFLACLEDEPEAFAKFQQFTLEEQKQYTQWIFSSDNEDIQVQRIALAVNNIAQGFKMNKNQIKK